MSKLSAHQLYVRRNNCNLNQRLQYKFSMCKAHAAERGIAFNLTFDEFKQMWSEQAGRCALTGKRMFLSVGRGYIYRNCTMSIDRLDPNGSYTKDNVILCRYDANRQKSRRNFFSPDFMETFPDFTSRVLALKPQLNILAV